MQVYKFDNMDADTGAFLSKQLEHIRGQLYDLKMARLKARELIPVDGSVPSGARTLTYRQFEMLGLAKILGNYSDDIPRANVVAREFTSKIRGLASSYGYSLEDARAAMMAGVPLDQKDAMAARRAIEEQIDTIARSGSTKHGLLGFLNQPNVSAYTVANGAGGTALWADKSPDEIVDDLNGIANFVVETTKEVEIPDTIIVPVAQFGRLTKRMGDGDSTTILRHFLASNPYIKAVIPWSACKAAGAMATDRMVCYRRDPECLSLVIPQEFEQLPPQAKGLEVVTNCHARCGGVVFTYPLSAAYGDGI